MTGTRVVVPGQLAERAREIAAGRLSPAVPRDAATIMLLREGPGVEAYLLRRTRALDFAPGACVFPGGSVDEPDADPRIGWAGPSAADVASRLGTSGERARALVCAAVRETFEESGVLLAGPSPAALVDDSAALAAERHLLLEGATSFGEILGRLGLMLRADLLTPWARWVTPEASPRRFDTWFFAAALPPGQTAALAAPAEQTDRAEHAGHPDHEGRPGHEGHPDHEGRSDHGESDAGTWLRPADALESARAGRITLLPPTAVTLGELTAHPSVAAVLAQRRAMTMRLPKVMVDGAKAWLALPDLSASDLSASDLSASDLDEPAP
jgi:8-oxo-dGTP pyrophosphatase MutT (NUDIX family)